MVGSTTAYTLVVLGVDRVRKGESSIHVTVNQLRSLQYMSTRLKDCRTLI